MGQESLVKVWTRLVANNVEVDTSNPLPVTLGGASDFSDITSRLDTLHTDLAGADGVEDSLDALNTATGTTTDAAVVTDTGGTHSGFLRGLVAILADVRNVLNHFLNVGPVLSNGTTFDPMEGWRPILVLPSLTDTTNGHTSPDFVNINARGLVVLLDVTARNGTGSIGTLTVQAKTAGGNYSPIATFSGLGITAPGVYKFYIYPGASVPGGYKGFAGVPLTKTMRVVTAGATDGSGNDLVYACEVQLGW